MDLQKAKQVIFTLHATERMLERQINLLEVHNVLYQGEIISHYENDKPFPSVLILGFSGNVPIHVVVGYDAINNIAAVITVYVPNLKYWNDDFRTRRRKS